MTYWVKAKKKLNFCQVEKAMIESYRWGGDYRPEAYAQLIYVIDKGFALKMTCIEPDPKTVYTKYNDPVYKDSCLEFFVSFNNKSKLYMNFEMNSAGAYLSAVRETKPDKTPIHRILGKDDMPTVEVVKNKSQWSVKVFFSLDVIEKLFGVRNFAPGYVFHGNFYKCGDETASPHFGAWQPIDSDKPNFHRPDCFGEFIIVQ